MASIDSAFYSLLNVDYETPLAETNYIAQEFFERDDIAKRQDKLSRVVSGEIIPRLLLLHSEMLVARTPDAPAPTESEIAGLANLVLSPDLHAAAAYIMMLRDRGLPMETLFIELLEPAARHLGTMWDCDECDFVDVTLGLGRLQKLLAIFNCTHTIPALNEKRRILMSSTPGDQHFFGLSMVNRFLGAGGWNVELELGSAIEQINATVQDRWFAVAGFTLGSERHLDSLEEAIASVRKYSINSAIGIMVGGPIFVEKPELVTRVGADGTAVNAPTAVIVAQKLFDIGALKNWAGPQKRKCG
jgi:MerR family transcriptional regulator, light-induced transcriptional regulator